MFYLPAFVLAFRRRASLTDHFSAVLTIFGQWAPDAGYDVEGSVAGRIRGWVYSEFFCFDNSNFVDEERSAAR